MPLFFLFCQLVIAVLLLQLFALVGEYQRSDITFVQGAELTDACEHRLLQASSTGCYYLQRLDTPHFVQRTGVDFRELPDPWSSPRRAY